MSVETSIAEQHNHFLVLGVKGYLPLGYHDLVGPLVFPDVFPPSVPVRFSIVLTQAQPADTPPQGRFLLSSAHPMDLRQARHYAHAIEALLPITNFCIIHTPELRLLPIREDAYESLQRPWLAANLQAVCASEIVETLGQPDFSPSVFDGGHGYNLERLTELMPWLGRYADDAAFQRAVSYLATSIKELGVDACDWREQDFDREFSLFTSVSIAESAFLNAYKAIEALVGDKGKDRTEKRYLGRLAAIGIEPSEMVGYREQESIIEKARRYYQMRDAIAAHGLGAYKRDLLLSEIIDLQALARHILLSSHRSR